MVKYFLREWNKGNLRVYGEYFIDYGDKSVNLFRKIFWEAGILGRLGHLACGEGFGEGIFWSFVTRFGGLGPGGGAAGNGSFGEDKRG
jgi:hypothetical protein